MDEAGATKLTVRPFADWVAVTEGSAWVTVGRAVQRFDARDGAELARIPIPGAETCLAMDVGFDSVWVGSCDPVTPAIVRIDAATGAIGAVIPLELDFQFEGSLGAGEGAVWAVSIAPDQVLMKIDPATDSVVATYPLDGTFAGVRAAYGGVWITQPIDDAVLRVDPSTGSVVTSITVGDTPRFIAVGEGAVWAMNEVDGTVSRIDPATNRVVASIRVTARPIQGGDIDVGGGSVWARVSDQLVARIDPVTNTVTARYGPASGSGSVAADAQAVWVSAHDVNAVWRLPID